MYVKGHVVQKLLSTHTRTGPSALPGPLNNRLKHRTSTPAAGVRSSIPALPHTDEQVYTILHFLTFSDAFSGFASRPPKF